ncbi:MAG: hypothetical protein ACKVY0_03575 [Prosthecobacter sp.]|uniref:hypothetical protein n=1 Tax=Prosthecobacter sp. TaxID=1965333 RepID=UPI0038FFF7E8
MNGVPPLAPSTAQKIDAAVGDALSLLGQTLQFQRTITPNHELLVVTGWNQTPAVRRAIAEYLVGLCVMAVNAVLAIRTDLVGPSGLAEVRQNVEDIIGVNGMGLTDDQVKKKRDPWIAEGIWHLCLAVSINNPGSHPPGSLFALSLPHLDTTEEGIDLAALYRSQNGIGLSIVETKAYRTTPSVAVKRAAKYFQKINSGTYRKKVREAVLRMRAECSAPDQKEISAQLWQERRWYIPNIHYDAAHTEDWTQPIPALSDLLKTPNNPVFTNPQGIIIMPHEVAGFDAFFNGITSDMMAFVASL